MPTLSLSSCANYRVHGRINSIVTEFTIDTGAAVSLVRQDVWYRAAKDGGLQLVQWSGQTLVGVNGSPLQTHGQGLLQFTLQDKTFEASVIVTSDLKVEVILGVDFLQKYSCVIDCGCKTLCIPSKHISMQFLGSTAQPVRDVGLVTVEKLLVPPKSQTEIMVSVTQSAEGGTWMVEGCGRSGVMVAHAIVRPLKGAVPLRIFNPGEEAIMVKKGVTIATMEQLVEEPKTMTCVSSVTAARKPEASLQDQSLLWDMVMKVGKNISMAEKEQLYLVLLEFVDVFSPQPGEHGHTTVLQHRIDTGISPPILQHPRRIPQSRTEEVRRLIDDMLKKDIIQHSSSPWSSPIVLVKKKDGSARFCVDYRKLNAVTKKDAYPLPRVDDTLDTLAGSKFFSTLDLINGYWQVEVTEEDRQKTAFATSEGLFEFKRMPFGLCNAPATFQRLMDRVLKDLKWSECLVYIDDIVIFGRTFDEHLCHIANVLSHLRQAGLKLKPEKCYFLQQEVLYLGHIVSEEGIATDPSKITAVSSWPAPLCKKDVQRFLGLANYYRRFIKGFADIAKPLQRLVEKNSLFEWTDACQNAFTHLRQCLVTAPVLAFPDYEQSFLLDTDASDVGIGAVLSQISDAGSERVIAYASRSLTRQERQYCVTRRELLAVVEFIQHFRHYLLGRQFTLRTDHSSIVWIQNFKEPEGQLARWMEKLQEYDFKVVHRRGTQHNNADALSRQPCKQCGRDSHVVGAVMQWPFQSYTPEEMQKLQNDDPAIGPVLQAVGSGNYPSEDVVKSWSWEGRCLLQQSKMLHVLDGVLWRRFLNGGTTHHQLLLPSMLRDDVLGKLHDDVWGGHLGEAKLMHRVQERYYWPGYSESVKVWCRTCVKCARRKSPIPQRKASMQTIQAGYPMQVVAVDIMGPLPETDDGNKYVLVAVDYFTRWTEAYGIRNQEAATVAKKLVDEVFCRFSPPEQLHSDQGRQFESDLIQELCKLLQVRKTRTTPYHPQCNGVVERFNRTLLDMLSTTVGDHPSDWDQSIRKLCMAYNSSVHSTTGFTPFFLMFGRQVRLPVDLMYGTSSPDSQSIPEYVKSLQHTLQEAHQLVREKCQAEHSRQKMLYDRRVHGKTYQVGDMVLLHSCVIPRGKCRKLHNPWTGPFQVEDIIGESVYKIRSPKGGKPKIIHFDRLKPFLSSAEVNDVEQNRESTQLPVAPLKSPSGVGSGAELLDSFEDVDDETETDAHMELPAVEDQPEPVPDRIEQAPHRYPTRTRKAPDRYGAYIHH